MDDPIDTGFGAVLAGEVYTHPELEIVTATVTEPPCDSSTAPSDAPSPTSASPPSESSGLTSEGQEAAKALIRMPHITWPDLARLSRELAMNIKEEHVILKEFGLDNAQFEYLKAYNGFFREAYAAHCKEWHAPLSTQDRIKVEAAAIFEDSLPGLGARMQNKGEGLPGVVEVAKLFAKVAGVGERQDGGNAPGERFSINIDLGGDQKITVSTSAPQKVAAEPSLSQSLLANTSP